MSSERVGVYLPPLRAGERRRHGPFLKLEKRRGLVSFLRMKARRGFRPFFEWKGMSELRLTLDDRRGMALPSLELKMFPWPAPS